MKRKYTVLGSGLFLLILIGWFLVVGVLVALAELFIAMPSLLQSAPGRAGINLSTYGMYAILGFAELLLAVPLIVYMAIRKISVRTLLGNRTNVRQNLSAALFGIMLVPALMGLDALVSALFTAIGVHPLDSSGINPQNIGEMFAGFLAIGVTAGAVEEPIFRGLAMRGLGSATGKRAAIWITALAFTLFHLDPVGLLERFLIGAVLGYMAWRAGALLPGMCAHAAFNSTAVAFGLLQNTVLKNWNGFMLIPSLSQDANGVLTLLVISIPFAAAAWGAYRLFAHATPQSAAWGDKPYAKTETRSAHFIPWIAACVLLAVVTAGVAWFYASGLLNNFKGF
jgi:membrane protease YdiL (CAAX protease family)